MTNWLDEPITLDSIYGEVSAADYWILGIVGSMTIALLVVVLCVR